jgi:polyisoprenoid-binding protein YceI
MGNWTFDPTHTQVEFSAKHLGMMTVRGHFAEVNATGELYPDHPEKSKVEVTINTSSIRTHNAKRDSDLRSSNFLEADKYPTIHFKSTKIEQKTPDKGTMTGDLTIKGITHPVTLNVVKYGEFNDPMMGHRIGYAADQGQPKGLWDGFRHDAGRQAHRQPSGPDQHRRRIARGGGQGAGQDHRIASWRIRCLSLISDSVRFCASTILTVVGRSC